MCAQASFCPYMGSCNVICCSIHCLHRTLLYTARLLRSTLVFKETSCGYMFCFKAL